MGDTNLSELEHQIGLLEYEIDGNAEFVQEIISLEERIDQDREFTHVLNNEKLRSFFRTIKSLSIS